MVTFDSFSLPEPVLRALSDMGFAEASPVQAAAIPFLLEGRDVIAQARTGTGKTAAFGIPLVLAAAAGRPGLVLVPTRELAQQVSAEIDRIGRHAGVRALPLYGGAPFGEQARALERGDADVLVATPGRLRDHLERGTIRASVAKLVVLDEADEMLKMGFIDEIEAVLEAVGRERQTMLFSATMPEPIVRLAERYLRDPELVVVGGEDESPASSGTEQLAVAVEHREKIDALVRILAVERPSGALVFRHTRESVDELVIALRGRGLQAAALHGGMAQKERDSVLHHLREGALRLVVATNVAARGLDVESVSHVFNYDAPREADAYVHRIGRTGRAGRSGRSFLFVTPADRSRLRHLERTLGARLAWHDVPSDAEVANAVQAHAVRWLVGRAGHANAGALEAIDAAAHEGADVRELAAGLLAIVARSEGLAMPPLEPRRARPARAPEGARNAQAWTGERVALTLSVGRDDGVRPGDVVGALTNEGGLVGADVGRIDILPRMCVAEVPAAALDSLFPAMRHATIRGRRVELRVAERWQFRAAPRPR